MVIVAAGMEGALPSVVGGLVEAPVIAVPTSIGYGASFQGLAALLAMLNSCASGVAVVNIDNGFGAGYMACVDPAGAARVATSAPDWQKPAVANLDKTVDASHLVVVSRGHSVRQNLSGAPILHLQPSKRAEGRAWAE